MMKSETKRKNSVVTATWAEGILTLDVLGAGSVRFDPARVNDDIRAQAACHGFEQRLRDRAAIMRDDEGNPATPEMKLERIRLLAEHYMNGGEWTLNAAGGGARVIEAAWVRKALSAIWDIDAEKLEARLERLADKKGVEVAAIIKSLSTQAEVAAKVATMKAGSTGGLDAQDLMDELENEG